MSTSMLVFLLLGVAFVGSANAQAVDIPYHAHVKAVNFRPDSTIYRVGVHFMRHWVKDPVIKLEASGEMEILKEAYEWNEQPCNATKAWQECLFVTAPENWVLLQPDPKNNNPRWTFRVAVYKNENGKGSRSTSLKAIFMAKHSQVYELQASYTQRFPPTLNLTTVATSLRMVGDVLYGSYKVQMANLGNTPIVAVSFALPSTSMDAQALSKGSLNGLQRVQQNNTVSTYKVVKDFFLAPGWISTGLDLSYDIPLEKAAIFESATITRYA